MSSNELNIVTDLLAMDESTLTGVAGTVALQQSSLVKSAGEGRVAFEFELEAFVRAMHGRLREIQKNSARYQSSANRLNNQPLRERAVALQNRAAEAESAVNTLHQRCLHLHKAAKLERARREKAVAVA